MYIYSTHITKKDFVGFCFFTYTFILFLNHFKEVWLTCKMLYIFNVYNSLSLGINTYPWNHHLRKVQTCSSPPKVSSHFYFSCLCLVGAVVALSRAEEQIHLRTSHFNFLPWSQVHCTISCCTVWTIGYTENKGREFRSLTQLILVLEKHLVHMYHDLQSTVCLQMDN